MSKDWKDKPFKHLSEQVHQRHKQDNQTQLNLPISDGGMVFNATYNNISVISWWSVLLLQETGVPGKKPSTCRKSLTNFIKQCCIKYTSS
jgi:hypothetical protein